MSDNTSSRTHNPMPNEVVRAAGLPKNYGDTKIIILPRDPMWLYAYWEVSPSSINDLRGKLGDQKFSSSRWVLRAYDVTDIQFNGSNAHRHFDISLGTDADNWYVNVGEVNRSWCIDLGLITPDGQFITVCRSNVVNMPRQGVSPITDEQWAILQREFEKLLKMSGVDKIGRSSFDMSRLMRERWEEIVTLSMPTSGAFGGASSQFKPGHEEKPKTFWLKADTELIVYGATEPDAKLTVQGQPVTLRPDGSFSLRFYLPDSVQEYPIKAVSSDGTMERQITFVVQRQTK